MILINVFRGLIRYNFHGVSPHGVEVYIIALPATVVGPFAYLTAAGVCGGGEGGLSQGPVARVPGRAVGVARHAPASASAPPLPPPPLSCHVSPTEMPVCIVAKFFHPFILEIPLDLQPNIKLTDVFGIISRAMANSRSSVRYTVIFLFSNGLSYGPYLCNNSPDFFSVFYTRNSNRDMVGQFEQDNAKDIC